MAGALLPAPTNRRVSVVNADTLAAVAAFLRGSHLLAPHDLPKHVADHGEALGFAQASMYLADLQQQVLVPFLVPEEPSGPDTDDRAAVLAIDSTLAGRVFQHVTAARQDQPDGRVRVWTPLLDGSERLGVLAVTVDGDDALDVDHPEGQRLRLFATLLAELVMSKTLYGDSMVRLRRTADMGLAAEIQWNLLPPLTFASPALSVAAALEPAYEVAGDSADYSIDPDVARFAVFDGMGHELRSAQLVALTVAAYRNARRANQRLPQTATQMDAAVTEAFGGEGFITALLAELDTATGHLSWLSAGHPAPLLLRHGRLVKSLEVAPMLPFGLGIGEIRDEPQASAYIGSEQLEPGDSLLLYTDGVVEARSPEGEMFGVDRLVDLITKNLASGLPAAETMRRAVRALLAHQSSALADDATLLLAQWRPDHPETLMP
jgi:serine phosphatase RsbU (regulator of sigma subunit)